MEATAAGVLRFTRGTLASISVSGRAIYQTEIEVIGPTGLLSAVNALNVERPVTLQLRRGYELLEQVEVANDDCYALQIDAFAAAIEEVQEFQVPGEEGVRNQLVLDAAYRSIKSGKAEAVAGS